ncbi:MAG: leucine-rich repeat domain-containing protein, partial [Clostridiales bacterium]|nr:leucine-rich repeat domain-containing protein [Clostridiales bacterium]
REAFWNCRGLTSITIPDSVTSIGNSAFSGCSGLQSIMVGTGNPTYASQDGILYNKAKTQFIHIPQAITGSVTIPAGVTSIGDSAFRNCNGLAVINYRGTEAKWNAITKGSDWNSYCPAVIVYNYAG